MDFLLEKMTFNDYFPQAKRLRKTFNQNLARICAIFTQEQHSSSAHDITVLGMRRRFVVKHFDYTQVIRDCLGKYTPSMKGKWKHEQRSPYSPRSDQRL
ncbi:hypothetical protein ABFV67_12735 [Vibrio metschnikovii]|uniref:Uncharacterized protein n=1 Tax=bacterium 19CA03SA04 TaxID=2920698 RepID=A0AAU6SXW4_UNCXX